MERTAARPPSHVLSGSPIPIRKFGLIYPDAVFGAPRNVKLSGFRKQSLTSGEV
jgi:hypothetical protein